MWSLLCGCSPSQLVLLVALLIVAFFNWWILLVLALSLLFLFAMALLFVSAFIISKILNKLHLFDDVFHRITLLLVWFINLRTGYFISLIGFALSILSDAFVFFIEFVEFWRLGIVGFRTNIFTVFLMIILIDWTLSFFRSLYFHLFLF